MKNPIDKNATISLDEINIKWFSSRELAQVYASQNNLANWTVLREIGPGGKWGYKLTWKTYK